MYSWIVGRFSVACFHYEINRNDPWETYWSRESNRFSFLEADRVRVESIQNFVNMSSFDSDWVVPKPALVIRNTSSWSCEVRHSVNGYPVALQYVKSISISLQSRAKLNFGNSGLMTFCLRLVHSGSAKASLIFTAMLGWSVSSHNFFQHLNVYPLAVRSAKLLEFITDMRKVANLKCYVVPDP